MKDNPIDPELQDLLASVTEHGRNQRRQQKLLAQIDKMEAEEMRLQKKRRPLWWVATTGIAASMLLVLTIKPQQQPLVAHNNTSQPLRIQQTDSMAIKVNTTSPIYSSAPSVSAQARVSMTQLPAVNGPQTMPESNAELLSEPTDSMIVTTPSSVELFADNLADIPTDITAPTSDRPVIKTVRAILGTESHSTESLRIKNETFAFNLALGPKEEEEMSQNSKFKPLIVNNL